MLFLGVVQVYAKDTIHVTETDTFHMSVATYIDSAFGSLDTTRISTKYLLDRVPGNFGPNHFNGVTDTIKNNRA